MGRLGPKRPFSQRLDVASLHYVAFGDEYICYARNVFVTLWISSR